MLVTIQHSLFNESHGQLTIHSFLADTIYRWMKAASLFNASPVRSEWLYARKNTRSRSTYKVEFYFIWQNLTTDENI